MALAVVVRDIAVVGGCNGQGYGGGKDMVVSGFAKARDVAGRCYGQRYDWVG